MKKSATNTSKKEQIDPIKIIKKYYRKDPLAYKILITHVELVTKKALAVAKRVPELHPNMQFIKEAAMLHDIGINQTHAPDIGCTGKHPYIRHGVLGAELLRKEGLPKHANVCERHTGVGLTQEEVKNLGLPKRDMNPRTIEEQIICFADKFYSKNPQKLRKEKTIDEIKQELKKYGNKKVKKFEAWVKLFKEEKQMGKKKK